MKAVILAGGLGTRISEESHIKPKPMVEIDGKPILWHILKIYSANGINDFIICCGYKGYIIKEYFQNYFLHTSDISIDLNQNKIDIYNKKSENWIIRLIDTGQQTMTGGRLKRVAEYLDNETFCFTYGDGLSDVDIRKLIKFHKESKKLATLTAVQPPGRFGAISFGHNNLINNFQEKPSGDGGWINGGFFVLEPKVIKYIDSDNTIWENEPLKNLAKDNELIAYKHKGFWQPMDTLRDKFYLEKLLQNGNAAWKKWA